MRLKKFVLKVTLIIILIFPISAHAQFWVEAFGLYSFPQNDPFASGTTSIVIDDETYVLDNQTLFTTFSEPSFGIGINARYAKKQLVVGMELSYVEYNPKTILLRTTMFRIGPTVEYFFLPGSKLMPYIGGEIGIQQSKVFFNGEVLNQGQLSEFDLGIGARAGAAFLITQKVSIRLGGKLLYRTNSPYLDLTLGVSYNLGDF